MSRSVAANFAASAAIDDACGAETLSASAGCLAAVGASKQVGVLRALHEAALQRPPKRRRVAGRMEGSRRRRVPGG